MPFKSPEGKFEKRQEPEIPKIESAWVITGSPEDEFEYEKGDSLKGNRFTSTLEVGVTMVGSTFVGYETVPDKAKMQNQDAIAINPKENIVAVMDGIGSAGYDGRRAALMLGSALTEFEWDQTKEFQPAINNAYAEIIKARRAFEPISKNAGTAFLAAHFEKNEDDLEISVWHAGDVRLIILDEQSGVTFASQEHRLRYQRNVITKSFGVSRLPYKNKQDLPKRILEETKTIEVGAIKLTLKKGQRVLIYSDGIGDNFTTEEIAKLAKNLSGAEAIAEINQALTGRMDELRKLQAGGAYPAENDNYEDGFISNPKDDNRSILIIDN